MEPVVFCTYGDDKIFEKYGGQRLRASLRHFYPDIPSFRFGSADLAPDFTDPKHEGKVNWCTIKAVIGLKLCEYFKTVIIFDCDQIVVDYLDEIINGDYDIAGCRNNSDKSHAGVNGPFTVANIGIFDYLNAGLVAVKKKEFWQEWYNYNQAFDVRRWTFAEQDSLNILAYSGRYKLKLLDPLGSDVYYGISNTWAKIGGCRAEDIQIGSNWNSWQHVIREPDGLYLISPRTGKKCKNKIFHHAGGGEERLTEEYFNKAAWSYITEVTDRFMYCVNGFNYLNKYLENSPYDYLEIGIFNGNGVCEIAKRHTHKKIYAVDPFIEDGYTSHCTGENEGERLKSQKSYFEENRQGIENIEFYEMTSKEFLKRIKSKKIKLEELNVGSILIDGSHHYEDVMIDIEIAKLLLKGKDGVIVFDDLEQPELNNIGGVEGVIRAVKEFRVKYKKYIKEEIDLHQGCRVFLTKF